MPDRLDGRRILILETREEAQFARLLQERGADVLQCPMFTIRDTPDPIPVEAWIRRCITKPFDDVVLMTGEGLRRLMNAARRANLDHEFVAALGNARKFARGPKPGKALREIGLAQDMTTEKPTSEGVIKMLSSLDLKGRQLGLQLYPDRDHRALIDAISSQGADVDPVTPYIYDTETAEAKIIKAVDTMAAGDIDAIALTSSGQFRRLFDAAKKHGAERKLRIGLSRTLIASVGPIVSDELRAHGFEAAIYPANDAFFMKPLISAMAIRLHENEPRTSRST